MAFTIRSAAEADFPAIRAIFAYADEVHLRALPDRFRRAEHGPRTDEFLQGCLTNPIGALFVADQGDETVGLIYLLERTTPDLPFVMLRRYAIVDTLAVLPHAQRRGIATALLAHGESWARERGMSEIELNVYEFNAGARALYECYGYATVHRSLHKRLTTDDRRPDSGIDSVAH